MGFGISIYSCSTKIKNADLIKITFIGDRQQRHQTRVIVTKIGIHAKFGFLL